MFSFFLFFFVIIQSCDASSEHVCNYCIQHFSDLCSEALTSCKAQQQQG